MQDISLNITEQKVASTEIAKNVETIAQMAAENHQAVSATTSSAQAVASLASEMEFAVKRFKLTQKE